MRDDCKFDFCIVIDGGRKSIGWLSGIALLPVGKVGPLLSASISWSFVLNRTPSGPLVPSVKSGMFQGVSSEVHNRSLGRTIWSSKVPPRLLRA